MTVTERPASLVYNEVGELGVIRIMHGIKFCAPAWTIKNWTDRIPEACPSWKFERVSGFRTLDANVSSSKRPKISGSSTKHSSALAS